MHGILLATSQIPVQRVAQIGHAANGASPPAGKNAREKPARLSENSVFLNIPYDEKFRRLYLAYISGLIHLGLDPHATIEKPSCRNRLEKVLDLVRSCRYSVHDLSRVELDKTSPRTPRFNMPFGLGLAVAVSEIDGPHDYIVFETVLRRASKSISDRGGADLYIHDGTVEGVMRELGNAFVTERASLVEMMRTYRKVSRLVGQIQTKTGAKSV
jgi:hypothetical protein